MRVLYVHQNFPAQFGHIAISLGQQAEMGLPVYQRKHRRAPSGVTKIHYKPNGGAMQNNHFCSRTFETASGIATVSTRQ